MFRVVLHLRSGLLRLLNLQAASLSKTVDSDRSSPGSCVQASFLLLAVVLLFLLSLGAAAPIRPPIFLLGRSLVSFFDWEERWLDSSSSPFLF